MATSRQSLRPLAICSRCLRLQSSSIAHSRPFSTSPLVREEVQTEPKLANYRPPLIPTDQLDPDRVATASEERRLIKHRQVYPIGSRRRRAAINSTSSIPFEQLPYQCFQEARKVLAADREEKVKAIDMMRNRIARLIEQDPVVSGGPAAKEHRLGSMRKELEHLKILADINDPMVKKSFEDGMSDMNKPIYRFLADRKWREYKRPLLMQRITQMYVVPDVLPDIDPVLDVDIIFNNRVVQPGNFLSSMRSDTQPSMRVQQFEKGEKIVTIVAVDSDVPNTETDSFDQRCHGIWANIAISPTNGQIGPLAMGKDLSDDGSTIVGWSPPFAQKGSPYHRISFILFEQPEGKKLENEIMKNDKNVKRVAFNTWSFASRYNLKPIGIGMFRCEWDEGTAAVMEKHGIPGADIMFKRKLPEKLPEKYRRKDGLRYRGWRK